MDQETSKNKSTPELILQRLPIALVLMKTGNIRIFA